MTNKIRHESMRIAGKKIDTEKTEWLVLKGAKETIIKYKPIILFETFKNKTNQNRNRDYKSKQNWNKTN